MRRAFLEAEAVVSGFEDVAVVGKPVEQRGRHLGIAGICRQRGQPSPLPALRDEANYRQIDMLRCPSPSVAS